jgi:antitoxin HigA-1
LFEIDVSAVVIPNKLGRQTLKSRTVTEDTTLARSTTKKPSARIRSHPGDTLAHEFMAPLDLSARGLAETLSVPPNRISQIVAGQRSIIADTALRLSRDFGSTPEFWMNLQTAHDLSTAAAEADYSEIEQRPAA